MLRYKQLLFLAKKLPPFPKVTPRSSELTVLKVYQDKLLNTNKVNHVSGQLALSN